MYKELTLDDENLFPSVQNVLKTLNWAMDNGATSDQLVKYVNSLISEISMKYGKKIVKDALHLQIGDVADINFCEHVFEEISGGHVAALVCDIITNEGLIFVLPIGKVRPDKVDQKNVIQINDAVTYYNGYYDGIVFLNKGRLVSIKRVNKIIGHISDKDFLKKLLKRLHFSLKITKKEQALVELIRNTLNERPYNQVSETISSLGMIDENKIMARTLIISRKLYEKYGKITYKELLRSLQEFSDLKNYSPTELKAELKKIFNTGGLPDKYSVIDFLRVYSKTYGHKL